MATEIERKFLVTGDGWRKLVTQQTQFRQGYLSSNGKATVRVRSMDDAKAYLTIKGASRGMSRAEYEYPLPIADAREMLAMAEPHVIEKTRHLVPFEGLVWEVDVFGGHHEGLLIAEVELTSEDQHVAIPDWIGREVTDNDRYYNASLARTTGLPA
jgi:adenylate cyclase